MRLDLSKLTAFGYSTGALTVLELAWQNKDIKRCLAFDPYFMPFDEDINAGIFKINSQCKLGFSKDFHKIYTEP